MIVQLLARVTPNKQAPVQHLHPHQINNHKHPQKTCHTPRAVRVVALGCTMEASLPHWVAAKGVMMHQIQMGLWEIR